MTKTSPLIRYCLTEDGDGHWWVIPVTQRDRWEDCLRTDSIPDWAVQIDGPHTLSFADWAEGDGDVDTTYART